MYRYTMLFDTALLSALRARHRDTYPQHALPFGPWLRTVLAEWLSQQETPQ